ncbi:MAG: hypothetical protein FWG55_04705 [Candidatus Bathyarchaeota archaeon]|nr:hypothetical protein [Candidatus Termiticorpusculum sp.]
MKAIKRNVLVCIVICTVFLLLCTEFQQTPVAFAATSTKSIVAYGAEAQIFVSMLSTETPLYEYILDSQTSVIVVSDITSVNFQSISNSMKNGAILVAINLPADNGLVDVPTMQVSHKQSIIVGRLFQQKLEFSGTSQEVIPPYWIVVTKQTTPSFESRCSGGLDLDGSDNGDYEQTHYKVMQFALDAVYSALFPDANISNRSSYSTPAPTNNSNRDGSFSGNNIVADEMRLVWPIFGILLVAGVVVSLVAMLVVVGVVVLLRKLKV